MTFLRGKEPLHCGDNIWVLKRKEKKMVDHVRVRVCGVDWLVRAVSDAIRDPSRRGPNGGDGPRVGAGAWCPAVVGAQCGRIGSMLPWGDTPLVPGRAGRVPTARVPTGMPIYAATPYGGNDSGKLGLRARMFSEWRQE